MRRSGPDERVQLREEYDQTELSQKEFVAKHEHQPGIGQEVQALGKAANALEEAAGVLTEFFMSGKVDQVLLCANAFLETMAPLKSGSVIGCGTIPDCTGLDHDDFLDPGDEVEISFERLGTLRCRFAEPVGELLPSRWPVRSSVLGYHGGE